MKLNEVITLPIDVGDEILTGKFKNKKTTVKDISYDEKGQLMINGKKALTFRIAKLMKQENEMKLGSVLNEATRSKKSKKLMKTKFSQVMRGDTGEDHGGEKFVVLAKASPGKFKSIEKYDSSGMMADAIGEEGDDFDMVAVQYDKGKKKAVLVFDEITIFW